MGRQQLVRTDTQDYFIDLVFYNVVLKCYAKLQQESLAISQLSLIFAADMYGRTLTSRHHMQTYWIVN